MWWPGATQSQYHKQLNIGGFYPSERKKRGEYLFSWNSSMLMGICPTIHSQCPTIHPQCWADWNTWKLKSSSVVVLVFLTSVALKKLFASPVFHQILDVCQMLWYAHIWFTDLPSTAWTQRKCIIIPNIDVDRKSTLEKASPEMLTPNCCYSAACPQLCSCNCLKGHIRIILALKSQSKTFWILPCGG